MSGHISGGYGDDLTVDEWLERIEPFIGMVQAERSRIGHPAEREDVMQEARIAVWKALEKGPEDPKPYLVATVKRRTTEVMTRLNWTGQPSQRGKASVDPLRRQDRDSIDEMLMNDYGAAMLVAAELIDIVDMAYHHGEIYQAVSSLPEKQREYVYYRFWQGMTEAEVAARIGLSTAVANNMWNRQTKPALVKALAHLR